MKHRIFSIILMALVAAAASCTLGTDGTGPGDGKGEVSIYLTDAPAYGFQNVWITLKAVWFHLSDAAGPEPSDWLQYEIPPHSIDLLTLCNGAVSPAIWDSLRLPAGTYRQIRLILAGTTDVLTDSAASNGLLYNNQVVTDTGVFPLHIPACQHGIRLAGTFTVGESHPLRLAIDFNAGEDVIDIRRNGLTEYFLKPRMVYFDLDNVGAIVGTIDGEAESRSPEAQFVFKAEQVDDPVDPQVHVVRRATVYDTTNHRFVLYPLPPGNYDIVMRGLGHETVILKNVPAVQGTTPSSGATVIPTITMTEGTDYAVMADPDALSPSGSWVSFFQTLPLPGEIPYEIRFRHLNPFTGGFAAFSLSNSPIRAGFYVDGSTTPDLTEFTPVGGLGGFAAVQDAMLYERGGFITVDPLTNRNLAQAGLPPLAPATPSANSISGDIVVPPQLQNEMDSGRVFVVFGGMIVHTIDAGDLMPAGGSYAMSNLPGGLPRLIYGVEAFGWSTTTQARGLAVPRIANLSAGDAIGVNMNMFRVR